MKIPINTILFACLTTICALSYGQKPASFSTDNKYKDWKQNAENVCIEPVDQIIKLIASMYTNLRKLEHSHTLNFTTEHLIQETLFKYNLLRENAHMPIANTFNEIDHDWFEDILKIDSEYRNNDSEILPTIEQEEIVHEAQKITNIADTLAIFALKNGVSLEAHSSKESIATSQSADLNDMLFSTYHELGHIKNKSSELSKKLREQELIFFTNYKSSETKINPLITFMNTDREVIKDFESVKNYTHLAQQNIDQSSKTGTKILKELSETTTFWNQPKPVDGHAEMQFMRWQEFKADLFAIHWLYTQKRLDPILHWIHLCGTSGYNTAEAHEDHPSHLERALIAIGFLISKGIDINKELRDWERKGQCKDIRKLYYPWSRLHKKEFNTFGEEYRNKLIEKAENQDFQKFKASCVIRQDIDDSEMKIASLAEKVLQYYEAYKMASLAKHYQKYALYGYNCLRNKLHMPIAKMFNGINKQWLTNIEFEHWKTFWVKRLKQLNNSENNLTLSVDTTIKSLIWFYNEIVPMMEYARITNSGIPTRKQALYTYNFMRELLNLPTIDSFEQINTTWIKEIEEQFNDEQLKENQ